MSLPNTLNELSSNSQQNLVQTKNSFGPYLSNGPSEINERIHSQADMDLIQMPLGSTNGTPLHHPPSLSSHSSRDHSPGSYRHGDASSISNSTNSPMRTVNGLIDQRSKIINTANNGFENISPLSSSHSSAQHSPALPQQSTSANFIKPPSIQSIRPNYPIPNPGPIPNSTITHNQNLLMPSNKPLSQNSDVNSFITKSTDLSNTTKNSNSSQQVISYITPLNEPSQQVPLSQSNPIQHLNSSKQSQPLQVMQTPFNPRPPISQPMMLPPNSKSTPLPTDHLQSTISAIPGMPMQPFQPNSVNSMPNIPSQGPPLTQSHTLPSKIHPNIPSPYDASKPSQFSPHMPLPTPSNIRPPMPQYQNLSGPPLNSQLPQGNILRPPMSQSMPPLPQMNTQGNPPQINPPLQHQPQMPQSQYIPTLQQPNIIPPPNNSFQNKSYPQQNRPNNINDQQHLAQNMPGLSITNTGFNKLWGLETIDLLQNRNVLPPERIEPPRIKLHSEQLDEVNSSTEIFRCTLTKIPETSTLLQKSRLPLGILIHPFKDLNHLPVIQCSTIVRCRACRTYINPFISFIDHKRWKCNLCFRVNDLPEEFQYDPISKTYGDPSRRPEIRSSTIEFIAPSEYMLRPPQPAVYLFALDVSQLACESGYLRLVCDILLSELDSLPGDGRTQIGFITYASAVHFYNLAEGLNQPQQLQVLDIQDIFVPCPDNLLVNLKECRELIRELLRALPKMFEFSTDSQSSLGAALQAAYKLMGSTGGRVSVFHCCLTNNGPGALISREDPSQRAGHDSPHLNPATDFYKRLALECSGQQIAVDLWLLNSQYSDLATLSGISRFSGGCLYHFPLFKSQNLVHQTSFQSAFQRYLTRKIGFEAVMRIRCSRGLSIHTFHGNFFVRSTDLLSLPNVNPDAGFGMQVSVDENLSDLHHVCFQAALLYTSSKGERRIRVHTLCLPVASILSDILLSADQQCIVGLLAKMAVDRSQQSSLSDARDAFINVAVDVLGAYKLLYNQGPAPGLLAPLNLSLLPLYILALLKHPAFRAGTSTRLDDRLYAMCQMKSLPLQALIQNVYPDLYPVPGLQIAGVQQTNPPRLHLSAEKLDSRGAYIMDCGDYLILYICQSVPPQWCQAALAVTSLEQLPEPMLSVPYLETPESELLREFITNLQKEKPYEVMIEVIRDSSPLRKKFIDRLIEDRSESALSYYEFLQHLKSNVK